jgi:hypothetical protein
LQQGVFSQDIAFCGRHGEPLCCGGGRNCRDSLQIRNRALPAISQAVEIIDRYFLARILRSYLMTGGQFGRLRLQIEGFSEMDRRTWENIAAGFVFTILATTASVVTIWASSVGA